MRKTFPALFLLCLMLMVLGCGQSGNVLNPVSYIVITPATSTMLTYTTQEFTAIGYNGGGGEVYFTPTWRINPYSYGLLSNAGRDSNNRPTADFTPTAAGSIEIMAFCGGVWGTAEIAAYVGTLESLFISPNAGSVTKLGQITFSASGEDSGGHFISAVPATWEVTGGVGTIDAGPKSQVTFYAGSSTGSGLVWAYYQGMLVSAEVSVTGITAESDTRSNASVFVDSSDPGTNKSGFVDLRAGTTWESLASFDLSGLSSSISIESVTLDINVISATSSVGSIYVQLYKVTGAWTESAVTWNTKPSQDSLVLGSFSVPAGSSGTYTITLNSDGIDAIRSWLSSPSSNYGFYFEEGVGNPGMLQFSSSRDGVDVKPLLKITYTY